MPIVQLQRNLVDKLYILWAICLVAHCHENNLSTSPYSIALEFGDDAYQLWKYSCYEADACKLLDHDNMKLTPKGQLAVTNWKRITQKLYAL